MKGNIFIWLCLVFCVQAIGQDNTDLIHCMTYNIRLDHDGDNENNWHNRKEALSQFLQASNPDFIGLQEAIGHQLDFIDQSLEAYNYIGVGRDDGVSAGEYSPILYNTDKWEMIESNTFWLSETPSEVSRGWDAACHRVVTFGLFVNKEGEEILVANTHFDHVGKIARTESIKLLNKFLVTEYADIPKVVMGDFNFTPDDKNYILLNDIVQDAFNKTKSRTGHIGTFNGFMSDAEADRRIDYILTDNKVEVLQYEVKTPKTEKGYQLSDHFPVIITCKIEE